MQVNRREFLRKSICAALGGTGLYTALGNLNLVAAAANAATPSDYKALVCVYLYGGNDSFNTIVPYDAAHYAQYAASRRNLALVQADVTANALKALAPPSDGGRYGLHPAMGNQTANGGNAGLPALFNSGKAAIVANVGSLLYPITSAQYKQGAVPTPPQLFSHDDQTSQWQTARPDDANSLGWGGRVADLLYANNAGQVPMSISLSSSNLFQRGAIVDQYAMDPSGVTAMSYLGDGPESWVGGDNPDGITAYNALIAHGVQSHVLERAFADATSRSISIYTLLNSALNPATPPPALATTFPDNELGNQLSMVAQLIRARATLGMNRQVFFVSAGNFDTHANQLNDQQDNLSALAQALNAFYNATVELGVANNVTAFTASDFGRSLPVNSTGTDHGWGGHHFVVGGAVRGGRYYGTMPSLVPTGNPDDTGYGQIIPTTSVDQYAATLATWLGVGASDLATIFPNLGRFSTSNLGFV